ncbi:hypothetical protein AMJ85_10740 [candidate division BRC1 bacterium SM23_51]|nr:MAG: hypothetical protein AMJ85_10740 [candidate division BRC1 bacterium SM23_51]
MSDVNTRADSIRVYNTGASSLGASQTDPDASLGNYCSSTEMLPLEWDVTNPISNVDVEYVAGANGPGDGTLTASAADGLKWTPPGGSQGTQVTIANGETKVIEGGGTSGPNQYIRVTRTSAAALSGTATITCVDRLNNVIGFDDVSSSEQSAGDDEYRCLGFENGSTSQVKAVTVRLATLGTQRTTDAAQLPASGAGSIQTTGSFADWPDVGYTVVKNSGGTQREIVYYSSRTDTTLTVPAAGRGMLGTSAAAGAATDTVDAIPGIAIARDQSANEATGQFTQIADEDTAPGNGETFTSPITDADAIDVGDRNPGQYFGIWIWREVPVGTEARLNVLHHLIRKFDAA